MNDALDNHTLEIIGSIRSPFKEKFGIPRQAGLVSEIEAEIIMRPPFDRPVMFEGLSGFSHIWLSFVFHQATDQGWRERVRPPRLGGNRQVGVFASRSPFRPNHLGLSVVRLLEIDTSDGVMLRVSGVDLLDGTPIVDIKPYVPYADAVPDAIGGFASATPEPLLKVIFSEQASQQIDSLPDGHRLSRMLVSLLGMDPRPAYQGDQDPDRVYGMRFDRFDVRWQVREGEVTILELKKGDGGIKI